MDFKRSINRSSPYLFYKTACAYNKVVIIDGNGVFIFGNIVH